MLISILLGTEYYIQRLKVFIENWLFSFLQEKYISFIIRYKSWFPWFYSIFYFITFYKLIQIFLQIKIPCIIFYLIWFYSAGFDSMTKFSDTILHVKELSKVRRLRCFVISSCVENVFAESHRTTFWNINSF